MRSTFSKTWNKSKQPRKQRKFLANAPLHIRSSFMNSNLSAELRKKYGKRSLRVRKGDKVKVMRGSFKGHEGKVERVDVKHTQVYVTGVEISKRDGSKAFPSVKPSNLMITEVNTDDKKRLSKDKKTTDKTKAVEKKNVKEDSQ